MYDTVSLSQRGVPTIVVCTYPFAELAKGQAIVLGGMEVPIALVEHPLASLDQEGVIMRGRAAAQQVSELWTRVPQVSGLST